MPITDAIKGMMMFGNNACRIGARPVRGGGGVAGGRGVGLGGDGEGVIEMRMDRTVVAAKESLGEAGFQSAWEAVGKALEE